MCTNVTKKWVLVFLDKMPLKFFRWILKEMQKISCVVNKFMIQGVIENFMA